MTDADRTQDARVEPVAKAIYTSVVGDDYGLSLQASTGLARDALAAADRIAEPQPGARLDFDAAGKVLYDGSERGTTEWEDLPEAAREDCRDWFRDALMAARASVPAPTPDARRGECSFRPTCVKALDTAQRADQLAEALRALLDAMNENARSHYLFNVVLEHIREARPLLASFDASTKGAQT